MRFLPHTDKDIESMLEVIGVRTLDDLFSTIPDDCQRTTPLELPDPLTEWELNDLNESLSGSMATSPEYRMFTGAGSYEHFIPATIPYLLSRSEFATAYTPYQPEISQGTLQGIFEYQTLVARLLGMEVANASLYEGASALAEALLMAIRVKGRGTIALSSLVHPLYREVVQTYLQPTGQHIMEIQYDSQGRTDISSLKDIDDLAVVAVQSPNFFGCIEDLESIAERTHERNALFVTCFTEPLAYGLIKSPGSQGADIACGEGQSFGIPQSFGGPALGMFAAKSHFLRNLPGRLVGQALDSEGKRSFVLTLATREQHIRREKATSNICTNSSLCALASAMYMTSLGGTGLRELASMNHDKAEYLKDELRRVGFGIRFTGPTFNEFVVEFPKNSESIYQRLLGKKIMAGIPLVQFFPELANHYLLCATETKTKNAMDEFVKEIVS
jgi:glycine dehydrogenase subunit 1